MIVLFVNLFLNFAAITLVIILSVKLIATHIMFAFTKSSTSILKS